MNDGVVVVCEGRDAQFIQTVLSCLDVTCEVAPSKGCEAERVAEILLGSKKTRLGPRPCDDHYHYLVKLVERYMTTGQPIEMVTMWGGLKGYGLFDIDQADLLDLLGLRRFASLNAQVRTIYAPGIRVRIIREDVTELILANDKSTVEIGYHMHQYRAHLCNLLRFFALDFIQIDDESVLLFKSNTDLSHFMARVMDNAEALYAYWIASDGVQDPSALPEYKALCDKGWRGIIPQCQRDWYIARVGSEYPDMDYALRVRRVCVYLGNALARGQFKMLHGNTSDEQGTIQPIKASFVPYPPGTASEMSKGRIEYKLKDSKSSNNTVPPWSGYCVVRDSSVNAVGVGEWRVIACQCERLSVTLQRGQETVEVAVAKA